MLESKMARRLVRLFVLIIGVPLVITVVLLQSVGLDQMTRATNAMEKIDQDVIREAGQQFQTLGHEAVRQSSDQTKATSMDIVRTESRKIAMLEADSLTKVAGELSDLTSSSFDKAMRQSLHTHHATLDAIQQRMAGQFTRNAQETQQQAAGNIERAMLALNDRLMRERAQEMAQQFTDHLHNAPMFLQFTAQMPDMRDGNAPGQKATLDALVRRLPEFLSVAVLDKSGRETAMSASDKLVTSADLGRHGQDAYFQQAMQGRTFMAVDAGHVNAAPVLRFAVPIEAYRGKIVGVVSARYSLENLWETIRGTRIGKAGYATVLDAQNQPLLSPRASPGSVLTASAPVDSLNWRVVVCVPRQEARQSVEALKADIGRNAQRASTQMQTDIRQAARSADAHLQYASKSLRDRSLHEMRRRFDSSFDNVSRATSDHTLGELARMQAAIEQQTFLTEQRADQKMTQAEQATTRQLAGKIQPLMHQELKRSSQRLSLLALAILIGFCSVGGVVALWTANRIVKPVLRLVSVTQSIADGDLERRVEGNAPDEIGDLAVAFNTMAARLQQSRDELKEAEAQLVQSAKLASLGTLSAGVAHELNQPVAIIRGVAQQLQDEPELSQEVLADLKLIEGQTSRMTKIILHLRTFCRVGGAESSRVDVHEVIQNCFMFVGAQLQAHNVFTTLELGATPPIIMGDANELEQVFLNLLTNARDALEGRQNACVTIRTRLVDGQVEIEFADNGPGISADIAAHIFDPFFTTKEPGKGTGLGLSISHNILKKHGGQIRVANRTDGVDGAMFTLTLPLAVEQEAAFVPSLAA